MSNIKKVKRYGKTCCVVNCKNSYETGHKLFNFPNRRHEFELKVKWIRSINRFNDDGKVWIPSAHSVVCDDHFIGNKPVRHPMSPAYIPTIFLTPKKKMDDVSQCSRSKRECNRNNIPQTTIRTVNSFECNSNPIDAHLNDSMDYVKPLTKCQSVQVAFDVKDPREFSFECCFYDNNCTSTSITTPTNFVQNTNVKDKLYYLSREYFDSCLIDTKKFDYKSIKNEKSLKNLTGTCYNVFKILVSMLPKISINRDLNNNNKLFLFLMKLRLGITFSNLGDLFSIHQTTAIRIFLNLLSILCKKTEPFISWPSKEIISETLPYGFKENYPSCRCIIQCIEITVENPPVVEQENIYMYSEFQRVKCLVGMTPNGAICFLSKCYDGQTSDKLITNDSGFISRLEPGDHVLANKGFTEFTTDCINNSSILILPPILKNARYNRGKNIENYSKESIRILIESFFARLEAFYILKKIDTELFPHIDNIMKICCTMINLQTPIMLK